MGIIESLGRIDWSFPTLSNSGIDSIHWYPATYLAAIPGTLIAFFTDTESVVMDPFCGSGTTGVEAIRLGWKFIGVDNSPVAPLMADAKLSYPEPKLFEITLESVLRRVGSGVLGNGRRDEYPNKEEPSAWYHSETLQVLNRLLTEIITIEDRLLRRFFFPFFQEC
ncbi:DNA methyltransferase [Azorhizophilus paspali]|uniref:DNA methyltransferase n=1 Tax=Azorhizophilus paspali TaxID=69963 RepID=UPI0036329F91